MTTTSGAAPAGTALRRDGSTSVGAAVDRFGAAARDLGTALRPRPGPGRRDRTAGLDGAERRRLLGEIDRTIAVLTSARADLLVAERESGAWRRSGDPSFEAWRARSSRAGTRAASAQVQQAETLARMPRLREAAETGAISLQHVEVLSRVAATATPPVREGMSTPTAQHELVALARAVDAGTFARSAARWAARHDPAAHERGHQAQRAARYLHLAETPQGTRVAGLLDAMAGHRLRLALEAVSPRPAADDERTGEQRRADALHVLADTVLALPRTASGAAVRPHVSFHLTAETWAGLRAHHRRASPAARTAEDEADGPTAERTTDCMTERTTGQRSTGQRSTAAFDPATLDDGTPVPMSEIARALCDCELTRIVIGADGAVLDLGRTRRTYTGAQRRAVIARDRSCAWPGCHGHARWGEVHHLRWWDRDGGETSVQNGVLLCSFHHHEVHRQDLVITRSGAPPGPRRGPAAGPGHGPPPGSAAGGSATGPGLGTGARGDPGGEAEGDLGADVALVSYTFRTPGGRVVAPRDP